MNKDAKQRERSRRWYAANKEQANAASKRHYERNADKMRERSRQWYLKNRERAKIRQREYHRANRTAAFTRLLATYGLTPQTYEALVKRQQNCCAICGVDGATLFHGRLAIDHDHTTAAVRGLLCPQCNAVLGQARDNPLVLQRAILYLAAHSNGG